MTTIDLTDANRRASGTFLLHSPSGDSQPLPVRGEAYSQRQEGRAESIALSAEHAPYLSIPPLNECGVWGIAREGSSELSEPIADLAVNLADDSESDLRTPSELIEQEPSVLVADWFTKPIWFYLTAAACLLMVIEWQMHQRRVIT